MTEMDNFKLFLQQKRSNTSLSIENFNFNLKRVQILSKLKEIKTDNIIPEGGILYWMFRDCRVQDNWALLYAQLLAIRNELPLSIIFCIPEIYLDYTKRHYDFLIKNLQELENECRELNINFNIIVGSPAQVLVDYIKTNCFNGVVCDFLPLKDPIEWQKYVGEHISEDVLFVRVDAHNIVPCWVASDKSEPVIRTFRTKINALLDIFLEEFPPVVHHKYNVQKNSLIDWNDIYRKSEYEDDQLINSHKIQWAEGGYENGIHMLETFLERIKFYATKRNSLTDSVSSNLSPWLNFGQISAQRCVLVLREVKSKNKAIVKSVNLFREQIIVRRELSDNFCYYNTETYNKLEGAPRWAQLMLNEHGLKSRSKCVTKFKYSP